jgi:proteasome accessory factor B
MTAQKFKPQFRRLLFIDQQIRAGKYPNCFQMSGLWELGCSYKTIQRDIDYMKYELDAPIEYDRKRHGFYYADKTWFLPSVMMSEGDIFALLVGTQALAMYKGTPVAKELETIYGKLAVCLPEKLTIAPELIFSRFTFSGPPAKAIREDVWKLAVRGLMNQRELEIKYQALHSRLPKAHAIHPYHLANLDGEWYLFAYEPRHKEIVQFLVGRIESVAVSERTFKVQANFNIRKLLSDRFGRFIHSEKHMPSNIRLLFAPELTSYISEKAWHPRQTIKRRQGGRVELRLPVPAVRDVIPWIMSFGSKVKVLTPKSLAEYVRKEHYKAAR